MFIVDFTRPEALSTIFKVISKAQAFFRLGQNCYLKVPLWWFVLLWCSCLFIAEKITGHMAKLRFLQTDQNFVVYKRQNFAFACLLLNGPADNNARHLQNISRKSHVFMTCDV
jgi:hypothetical protein